MSSSELPPLPGPVGSQPLSPAEAGRPPAAPAPSERAAGGSTARWRVNLLLFLLTVGSVFFMGALYAPAPEVPPRSVSDWARFLAGGWTFAVPLLAILLFHEFGHYIAARLHRVDASLPYFLPLPFLSPFGTLGAVIAMRGRIRSKNALLDIGASGPVAGLLVAVPVLVIGLALSPVGEQSEGAYIQEGQSLLYLALKWLVHGAIPDGHDVFLHPTAFAGWAGLLVTMLNLLPWGQLDGGHIAYALLGPRHHRVARFVRLALLPLFAVNLALFGLPVLRGESDMSYGRVLSNSIFWLVWFVMLGFIARLSGGEEHPPVDPGELSPLRKAVAVVCLALFVLLFMPTPWAVYGG